jgi:hypothetical protein
MGGNPHRDRVGRASRRLISKLKEHNMSGFDTSQPISDDEALKDVETDEKSAETSASDDVEEDELGDATPGPR